MMKPSAWCSVWTFQNRKVGGAAEGCAKLGQVKPDAEPSLGGNVELGLAPPKRGRSIIYSDATGAGDLAWVAKVGTTQKLWSAEVVPRRLRRWACKRKVQIATW